MGLPVTTGAGVTVEDWAATAVAAARMEMIETSIVVLVVVWVCEKMGLRIDCGGLF
jgi:hypothetical protein